MSTQVDKPEDEGLTPNPYRVGQSLTLRDSDGTELSADITHEYPFHYSPVVAVNLHKDGVVIEQVILKLYDRRFGSVRKRLVCDPRPRKEPQPHNERSEAAFWDFARSGMLVPFLDRHKHEDLMYRMGQDLPEAEEEEIKPEQEILAEQEAIFYYKTMERYSCEVRAYDKMKPLQGRGIPRFFKAVTLQMPSAPSDIDPCYFQVPGILIEKINGFKLSDLVTELPAEPPNVWTEIVQAATDLAVEINRAGVIEGSGPSNVLVTRHHENGYEVRRIGFGAARLDSDPCFYREGNPDYFKDVAASSTNHVAIGAVMANKVKKLTGIKLNISMTDEIWPGVVGIVITR
ncbi:hypothetical protein F4808DRAFT_270716 [Astrocystis sublimbata]|nr:hypothetical protein F4808DRAFT_270716 [Astrocystis sublimbata]